jgi:hypothetical protein
VRAQSALRVRAARRLAALGLIALGSFAVATSPALAGGSGHSAQRGNGKTITLRYYSVVTNFVYRQADGTVVQTPPQNAAVGDQMEITELAYKGNHVSHAKKWSASSYTICVFKSAKGAPTCEGVSAVGGNQLLIFHTPSGGDPIVAGGTGRFAGATGGVKMTQIGDTNNSDVVITLHLRS